jgi:hypothetical protein
MYTRLAFIKPLSILSMEENMEKNLTQVMYLSVTGSAVYRFTL